MEAQETISLALARRVCTDLILAVHKAIESIQIPTPETMPDSVWDVLNGDRLLTAKAISSGCILAQEEAHQNVMEAIEKVLKMHRDALGIEIITQTEEATLQ